MFSIFKKKPSAMDATVAAIYGPDAKRTAVLSEATRIAHAELLDRQVSYVSLSEIGSELLNGPMPYSTHDLAVSIALNVRRSASYADNVRRMSREATVNTMGHVKRWEQQGRMVAALSAVYLDACRASLPPETLPQPAPVAAPAAVPERQGPAVDEGLRGAMQDFYVKVVTRADEMFAHDWPHDPQWVGTLSVAEELDTALSSTETLDQLTEFIVDQFMKSIPVEKCATLVMLKHMANQRKLEDIMRQSGTGGIYMRPT